ncbi:hypothetical protein [Mucilaginibacter sp. dw_454]|uniref:hypothetical protein n=1 Tax=Mucilaginibacter sp. dw_454 TaxID=2720079 RepID=UPI001BD36AA2|nr:hypothetical protein [Mucilaginibacter sp. dw_454]
MNIKEYIESGVLESYVLGSASAEETHQLLRLKNQYPEIADALFQIETDFERVAQNMAMVPPPGMLTRIEDEINALIETEDPAPATRHRESDYRRFDNDRSNQFIEIEAFSNQMRLHKAWRWVFAGVFILGKIFLIAAIYYFLENRQAQEQIHDLKTELRQYKH